MTNPRSASDSPSTDTRRPSEDTPLLNLTPGPVRIDPVVHEAFRQPPISHRSPKFRQRIRDLGQRLSALVNASHATLLLGSGTLANDAIAAQLSRTKDPGLVLVNGEFGRRLVDAAQRAGLRFETVEAPWGAPLPYEAVRRTLAETPKANRARWLWAVHCETSTGVLNDLERLKTLAEPFGLRLCLDAISSIGTLEVDLDGVAFASCASGKGLSAYAGIATVFHDQPIEVDRNLPRYLDLGLYAQADAVPFTTSSNLVAALAASPLLADEAARAQRHEQRVEASRSLRTQLEGASWRIMAPEGISSPAVLTLLLDSSLPSSLFGETLERLGLVSSYRSRYLSDRNIIQLCLMADHTPEELDGVAALLDRARQETEVELVKRAQSALTDHRADSH